MTKYIFLLGGKDLEMLEIEKLLKQNEQTFYNEGLNWNNASWKAYQNIIDENQDDKVVFVGIELRDKDSRPGNSIDIDHHNYERCKPASIEQIAELLALKLTPWQQKIAVNDKSYITGLLKNGLPFLEIEEIRQKDREAQGLSVKECVRARQLLEKQPPVNDEKSGLTIWEVPDDWKSFVPLSDAYLLKKIESCFRDKKTTEECVRELEKVKLIIYHKNNFIYSGYIPVEILEKYEDEINRGEAYFGGAEKSGYFGFVKDYVIKKGSKKILTEWQDIMKKTKSNTEIVQNKEMYSYHIFLFPFRWRLWDTDENVKMSEKFNINEFEEVLTRDNKQWERRRYELKDGAAYNEYNYFFDFVREILYDLGDELRTTTNSQNEQLIRHFEYKPGKNAPNDQMFYNIKVKNITYSLEIDSILLNVYSTGVGVLSFHLRNFNHEDKDDILKINKFGRRLYPPFFSLRNEGIKTGIENTFPQEWLPGVKNNEIPEAIWLSYASDIFHESVEDFGDYTCKDNIKYGPFRLPKYIKALFSENFFLTHEKTGCKRYDDSGKHCVEKSPEFKIYLRPALDDRMYTLSWYGNDSLVEEFKKINYELKPVRYQYVTDEFWHNYIFVDTWRTYQNSLKLPEFLEAHTYSRWVDYGTLYGFSRYSMVMLTAPLDKLENLNAAFLVRHLQSMYYKMAELALLQRATIISFSDEVTHVSDLIHQEEENMDKAIEKIEDLYKHYILFVNKIFFREVTAQEQGIEMYDMMQKNMRIPDQVKDLDDEIAELNAFAAMIADKNEKKEMKLHTILATIFLPAMAIAGLLGINTMSSDFKQTPSPNLIHDKPFVLSLIFIFIATVLFWMWYKLRNKDAKIGFYTLLIWLFILFCFSFGFKILF